MDRTILILDITGAHFQAACTVGTSIDAVAYEAGAAIDLHYADQPYATRPDDADPTLTYEPRLDGKITIDRSALLSGTGQAPRVGGMAMPRLSKVVLANGDGRLNWMRLLSLDGAVATLRELPLEQDTAFSGRLRPVLQSDPAVITWFSGACAGEPGVQLDKNVELELVDRFDDRLRKPVQTHKFQGNGGAIAFTAGAATVAHASAFNVNQGSFVCLFRHTGSATDRAIVCKDAISTTLTGFFVRLRTDGRLSARWNTGAGSVLMDTVSLPAADTWYWVVLTYNAAAAVLRYYTMESVLVEEVTTAQTGTTLTTASSLVFGSAPGSTPTINSWVGSLSQIRLYSRALTLAEIPGLLRPLDLDESDDTDGLVGYWPCFERTGAYLTDKIGKRDAVLGGTYAWGSTLTGEASQRDQYLPIVLGPLQAVPLTSVDGALDIWTASATSAQQILRVYKPDMAGLTPTFAVSTTWALNTTLMTLERTDGSNIASWVPGMSVTLGAGWVTNLAKVLAITDVLSLTRARVTGTGLTTESVTGLVTANSPQWVAYTAGGGAGQYVQMLTDVAQPVAWVQGENLIGYTPYLGGIFHWLLTESQADLDYDTELTAATVDRIEGTGTADFAERLMGEVAAVYIPAGGPVTVYDLLERICKATGLHIMGIGDQLEIGGVELPSDPSAVALVDEEVADLDVDGLKVPPPAVFKRLYRDPPYAPAPETISPGAIPWVAELIRSKGVIAEQANTAPSYSVIWPSGTEEIAEQAAEWSPMQSRIGAKRILAHEDAIAQTRPWRLRVLADVGDLLPGSSLTVAAGRAGAEPSQLYGLEAGVDCVVVASSYDVLARRYNVTVLVPVQDLEP